MKLTKIAAENFKGRTFQHDLGPVTVITGPNFSGKTAVLDAIRVGLMGYLPRLGKQAGSTWKLAGDGTEMTVTLDTDTTTLAHAWRRKKDSAAYEGALPWETPLVMLDAREYFQQTAAQRINTVFQLCDPAVLGYTDRKLLGVLEGIEVVPTKVSRPIVTKLIEEMQGLMARRNGRPVQEWLAAQVERLKAEQKEASTALKLSSSQQVAYKSPWLGSEVPKDGAAAMREAEAVKDQLLAEVAAIEMAASAHSKRLERRHVLATTLSSQPDLAAELADLELQAKELAGAAERADTAKLDLVAARGELRAQKEALAAWNARMEQSEKQRNVVLSHATCPTCGSRGEGWRTSARAKFEAEGKELASNVAGVCQSVARAEAAVDAAKARWEAADKEAAEMEKVTERLCALREQARKVEGLHAELAAIDQSAPDTSRLAGLKEQAAQAQATLAGLREKQSAYEVWAKDRERRDTAEAEVIRRQAEVEVLKAAVKAVTELQVTMLAAGFNDLLAKARRFTAGILRSDLVYCEGDLGRIEEGHFINWETFSGTEEAIAFAGLGVALAQHAPVKVVLLDELGRLTADNKRRLVERMVALVAEGVIDSFVGVDVEATPYQVEGVRVIKLA